MIAFWIAAAVLSAAAAALIIARAGGAARTSANAPDPSVDLYRRQLSEVDDLADRGLLDEADRRQAFAEAARRLLAAGRAPSPTATSSPSARRAVTAAAAAAALAGVGVYLLVGAPGTADAPFAQRLQQWREVPPETLDPLRAVALMESVEKDWPNDPKFHLYLGRMRLAAGDAYGAVDALRRAVQLDPRSAEAQLSLGMAQAAVADAGPPPIEAEAAFRKAVELEPGNLEARYGLGKVLIARGDAAGGVAIWMTLRDTLPAGDPRRAALEDEIAQTQKSNTPLAAAKGPDAAMIQGMVARLAARLDQSPDDPAGWARLVRSYGVLGDQAARDAALAKAKRLFADRPKDLARIEAAASQPPPSR